MEDEEKIVEETEKTEEKAPKKKSSKKESKDKVNANEPSHSFYTSLKNSLSVFH